MRAFGAALGGWGVGVVEESNPRGRQWLPTIPGGIRRC